MAHDDILQHGAMAAAANGSEVDADQLQDASRVDEMERRYRFAPPLPPVDPVNAEPDDELNEGADVVSLANWVAQVNAMMGGEDG